LKLFIYFLFVYRLPFSEGILHDDLKFVIEIKILFGSKLKTHIFSRSLLFSKGFNYLDFWNHFSFFRL